MRSTVQSLTDRAGDAVTKAELGRFFPVVGLGTESINARANFGNDPEKPFKYDPSKYGTEATPPDKLKGTAYPSVV